MIVLVEGNILFKDPTKVVLKTSNGIGYEIKISLNTYNLIDKDFLSLHTIQVIREDAHLLFGFANENEKLMFAKLIKVNGIGPSTALSICSTFTPNSFFEAISANDINAIKSVPGIGPKSAKRLLVELSDFTPSSEIVPNSSFVEATLALESLGFKKDKITKVLSSCKETSTSNLIKEALRQM